MMKKLLFLLLFIPAMLLTQAQEEIVKWTFPTGSLGDSVQNGTNPLNLTRTIRVEGTAAMTMTNGQASGDYAATATGWDNGADVKNWNVRFKTTGYTQVKISSKQRAGGTNGGPRDFKMQYRITSNGTWTDIPGSTVTLANNWTTGVVTNLDLPAECQNQSGTVNVRWVMASNTDVNGGTVGAGGVSKIDDIVVTGMPVTGVPENETAMQLSSWPNPATGSFSIRVPQGTTHLSLSSASGKTLMDVVPDQEVVRVDQALPAGMYIISAFTSEGRSTVKQIVR
jgi:hypothetical protein